MNFEISFLPDAQEHLARFSARDQTFLLDEIDRQLLYEPDRQTRNRKPLGPNELATWELRVGKFRVFYDIETAETMVAIIALGLKGRNRLLIGDKEYHLK